MHRFHVFIICFALSLWGLPVLAQWSGSADLYNDACYGNVYRNTVEEFLKPE